MQRQKKQNNAKAKKAKQCKGKTIKRQIMGKKQNNETTYLHILVLFCLQVKGITLYMPHRPEVGDASQVVIHC